MSTARPGRHSAAFGIDREYSWDLFQSHVAGLSERLSRQPEGRWLLSCGSAYAFGVGLLALWQTDRIPVLPPNQQPESMREASRGVRGVLSDVSLFGWKIPVLSPAEFVSKRRRWKTLHPDRTRLELFTSGSAGDRKAVVKTLGHLDREVAVLEKTFGQRLGACSVYATVSHQHIYGLLFRLLWPLCAGRPFSDDTFLFWEELASRLPKHQPAGLVSSPAHLERVTPAARNALRTGRLRIVFSSGGPLRESVVDVFRKTTGQAPIEVFGSTETGGIGWRQRQRVGFEKWNPLKGVTVTVHPSDGAGRLRVKSPFVSSPDGRALVGDRGVVFHDGRFEVAGRADRVVKMAEKRLSLDDMESRLERHAWVEAAKIVMLDPVDGAARASMAAVVILSPEGRAQAQAGLTGTLRRHLAKSFDLSTTPRLFRFIDSLPVDPQGKASRAALASLFHPVVASSSVTQPQRLQKKETPFRLSLRLRVPEDLRYLQGHFPGRPIVPGIVQIRWVIEAAAELLGRRPVIRRMEAIKFKTLLLPGNSFTLVVERHHAGPEAGLRFSLAQGKTHYSSGRLVTA